MRGILRLFARRRLERDLSEEIRGHLDERIDELLAQGASREDAVRQARREFGNLTLIEEQSREVWKWRWVEDFLSDVRFAFRQLRKAPTFTAAAVLTLALGIGANTAIFSIVNGVLLQPLPYRNPDRLVQLNETTPTFHRMWVAYPNFVDWKAQSHSFDGLAAFYDENYDLTGSGEPEHLRGKLVSADFFRVLGIQPVLGRGFDARKDRLDTPPVVMIDGGLWSRRFGSDPGVLGAPLVLSGRSYTIVGIVPAGFQLEGQADVYLLLEQWDDVKARSRDARALGVVGRLKPGITQKQAESDMSVIAARLAGAYPKSNAQHGINITPLKDVVVGSVGPRLLMLLGAVGFVLLIACANVANLLLARLTGRQQEIAIRTALGAGRGRVVRQLLTENVVLAIAGGLAGLALAAWGTRAVVAAVPNGIPRLESIDVDGMVLAFTLGVSLLTGIGFGLVPARHLASANLRDMLTRQGRGSSTHGRLRGLLVTSEVAAALVLLVGAGLMVQTVWRLGRVNPGFDPEHVLTLSVGLSPANRSSGDRILQTIQRTVDRIERVPGVKRAAVSGLMPLSGGVSENPFYVNGRPRPTSQDEMSWALLYPVSPGYFDTMAIPLLRGRDFSTREMRRGSHVVVIDEVMARLLFPHEDPIGKSLMIGLDADLLGTELSHPLEIVGIAGHVSHWGLDSDPTARVRSEVYIPFSEIPDAFMKASVVWNTFIVRTEGDPLAMLPTIRRAILDAGNDQPVYDVRTLDQIVSASFADRRFSTVLLGSFAGLALLLAGIGIYGVISYTVAQRAREIGILVALGAGRRDVFKEVVARGMLPVFIGLGIGSIASLALTRVMSGMLYGVSASDPATLLGVALILAAVALVAALVPARRAAGIAPIVALRCE